jgi:ComF family protein
MVSAGAAFWAERPILVPVPLHRVRQLSRRYNQSAELARALARLTGATVDSGLVSRVKRTRQQVGLSADARQRNVAGAFVARPDAAARAGDRRVVIVDDVITTGSTVNAVTKALKKAGIDKIDVISFARVVVGDDLPA